MTTKHTSWRITKGGYEIKEVANESKLVAICTEKKYAQIIAAAPDLLKALESSLPLINEGVTRLYAAWLNDCRKDTFTEKHIINMRQAYLDGLEQYDIACAAIAKAKGSE